MQKVKFGWKPRVLISEGHVTPIYVGIRFLLSRCIKLRFKKKVKTLVVLRTKKYFSFFFFNSFLAMEVKTDLPYRQTVMKTVYVLIQLKLMETVHGRLNQMKVMWSTFNPEFTWIFLQISTFMR